MKHFIAALILLFFGQVSLVQAQNTTSAYDSLKSERDVAAALVSQMKVHSKTCRSFEGNNNLPDLRLCLDEHQKIRNSITSSMTQIYLIASDGEAEALAGGWSKEQYKDIVGWFKDLKQQIVRDLLESKPSLVTMELRAQL